MRSLLIFGTLKPSLCFLRDLLFFTASFRIRAWLKTPRGPLGIFKQALAASLLANLLHADPPSPTTWFQPPEWQAPRLSPDGNSIAALRKPGSSTELWILPAENPAGSRRLPTPGNGTRVADVVWSGPNEVVLLTLNPSGGGGFWTASITGGTAHPLLPPRGATFVRLLHPQPRVPGRVWVEGIAPGHSPRKPRGRWLDLLALDTTSGQIVHSTENPGDVVQWTVDKTGTPRLALAVRENQQELRVANPSSARDPWRTAASFDVVRDSVAVAGISPDGRQAWITAHLGRDTLGIHAFDLVQGRFTRTLISDDRFDIDGRLLASDDGPVSQSWQRLQPRTAWFDARWEEAMLRAQAGNASASWSPVDLSRDGSRAVMEVTEDRQPPRFAVVSRDGTSGAQWFPSLRVDATPLGSPQTPVEFAARDGQSVTGYLTHPATGGSGPLLVLVHGGPWSRDVWGWQPEVQFFASRGWSVLQVNYRGSAGFGRNFQEAPAGRWADLPTSDLVDGARWAIRQGFGDPAKVVVAGASFGGQLTLTALTQAPELFRAGVSLEGIFDLGAWLENSTRHEPEFQRAVEYWHLLGPGPYARWNPRRVLTDLRSPLLLLHAEDDAVVPASQSSALASAARRIEAPVELRLLPQGGHTLGTAVQQASAWATAEKFLARNVGKPPPN